MRKGDIDRFFLQVADSTKYPVKIYLTGGVASWFMGGDRPTEDIDFGMKVPPDRWREMEQLLQETSRQIGIPVQFSEDIGRWGMIGVSKYEKGAKLYKRFRKVSVYLLSVSSWSIGKINRYYQSDIDDLKTVLKRQKTPPRALLRAWAEALLQSPRSSASHLFIKTVEDFLTTYGQEIWGKGFDSKKYLKLFRQLAKLPVFKFPVTAHGRVSR